MSDLNIEKPRLEPNEKMVGLLGKELSPVQKSQAMFLVAAENPDLRPEANGDWIINLNAGEVSGGRVIIKPEKGMAYVVKGEVVDEEVVDVEPITVAWNQIEEKYDEAEGGAEGKWVAMTDTQGNNRTFEVQRLGIFGNQEEGLSGKDAEILNNLFESERKGVENKLPEDELNRIAAMGMLMKGNKKNGLAILNVNGENALMGRVEVFGIINKILLLTRKGLVEIDAPGSMDEVLKAKGIAKAVVREKLGGSMVMGIGLTDLKDREILSTFGDLGPNLKTWTESEREELIEG